MDRIRDISIALNNRFPEGNEPYQMVARLCEECGEVAKEVNHWQNSGVKREKYGEPNKSKLAGEIKNVLTCAYQLALYYDIEAELDESLQKSLERIEREGLLNKAVSNE